MNYIKIQSDNQDYYLHESVIQNNSLDLRDLLKLSSFVVDRSTNSFIKCRASLGELVGSYLEKH